jgi:hypothetical protein
MSEPTLLRLAVAPAEDEQRQRCIDLLETALAEAKSGRGFDAVVIFATYQDSMSIRQLLSTGYSHIQLVGYLEHAKHELLAGIHESVGVPPQRPEPGK